MKAGLKLNKLIAEKVLGYKIVDGCKVRDGMRTGIPHYSTKIEWAWKALEKLKEKGYAIALATLNDSYYIEIKAWIDGKLQLVAQQEEKSAPRAICLAALKAVGVDIEKAE